MINSLSATFENVQSYFVSDDPEGFTASTTLIEKVTRVAHNVIPFVIPFLAIYAIFSPTPQGIIVYALYGAILYCARKIAAVIISYLIYPAAISSDCERADKTRLRENAISSLREIGYQMKEFSIYKSGIRYDALEIRHTDTADNGHWTMHALGNCQTMEDIIQDQAKSDCSLQSNTLLINGPSVINSEGWPTRYQLGAAYEAGLQYLEQKDKISHIAMKGFSLGGGMISEAILQHDFKAGEEKGIRYLCISDRTFGYVSSAASAMVTSLATPIFYLLGIELDSVSAAKKLSEHQIQHIIIQHNSKNNESTDDVIPDRISLMSELRHPNLNLGHKTFLESPIIRHNNSLPDDIASSLNHRIATFFQS